MGAFIRLLWTALAALWRPPVGVQDTLRLQRRVGVSDLDFNLHMNHARYLARVEQALLEGLQRSGFLATLWAEGGMPMVGGTLISYRRELRLWQPYTVALRYLGADPHWHVFSFRFLARDGRVVALGLVKGAAVRRRGPRGLLPSQAVWHAHAQRHPGLPPQPDLPPEALTWLQAERLAHEAGQA